MENPTTTNGQDPGAVSTTLSIEITWDQMSGQLGVKGQFVNKVVAYGMLELAKETLKKFFDDNEGKVIIPAGINVSSRRVS